MEKGSKTLKELQDELGWSRRVFQEYERIGIMEKPNPVHNKIVYSKNQVNIWWLVKFYREVGYGGKEIKNIIQCENFEFNKQLEDVIPKLKKQKERIENLILAAESMEYNNLNINELRDFNKSENPMFNRFESVISLSVKAQTMDFNSSVIALISEKLASIKLSEESYVECAELFGRLMDYHDEGLHYDDIKVQKVIQSINRICYPWIHSSSSLFILVCELLIWSLILEEKKNDPEIKLDRITDWKEWFELSVRQFIYNNPSEFSANIYEKMECYFKLYEFHTKTSFENLKKLSAPNSEMLKDLTNKIVSELISIPILDEDIIFGAIDYIREIIDALTNGDNQIELNNSKYTKKDLMNFLDFVEESLNIFFGKEVNANESI